MFHSSAAPFQFQDLNLLLGSDLIVWGNEGHPKVSLHLHDVEREVNQATFAMRSIARLGQPEACARVHACVRVCVHTYHAAAAQCRR